MSKDNKDSQKKQTGSGEKDSRNICAKVTVSAWLKASRIKWNRFNKRENPGV